MNSGWEWQGRPPANHELTNRWHRLYLYERKISAPDVSFKTLSTGSCACQWDSLSPGLSSLRTEPRATDGSIAAGGYQQRATVLQRRQLAGRAVAKRAANRRRASSSRSFAGEERAERGEGLAEAKYGEQKKGDVSVNSEALVLSPLVADVAKGLAGAGGDRQSVTNERARR
jgi:hypothetical protein